MEHRRRKHRKPKPVEPEFVLRRRWWVLMWVVSIPLAIVGIVLYARHPGVGTYQLNGLMILPLLGLLLHGAGTLLPLRTQWILAVLIAPAGSIAYLVSPDAQWFNYGPLTAVPLGLLAAVRLERTHGVVSSYGGIADGPFGPP